jgi:hypothetical protein
VAETVPSGHFTPPACGWPCAPTRSWISAD